MRHAIVAVLLVAAVGCGKPRELAETVAPEDERPALSFTDWDGGSELFIELPALVQGQESACAAHVTRLEPFSALAEGTVTVVLRSEDAEERFVSDAPSVPGIFRPIAVPRQAGMRRLSVEIAAPDLVVTHDLGEVMVYADIAAAQAAIEEEPEGSGTIVFLKEQQWVIDFATAEVEPRPLRPSLAATGRIAPRSDGQVDITAPVAGRVVSSNGGFPRVGDRVTIDDSLAVLAPRLEATDQASLDLAVKSAVLEVRYAQRERERLEALHNEGAVPERRVLDAKHMEEEAAAALGTAQRRLGQFRRLQKTRGRGEGTVALRSPLSGTITSVEVAPGSFVEAGAPLLRVTDLTQLWLEARVPEADAGRMAELRGATAIVEGFTRPLEVGAGDLVARGNTIDPRDHTLHVVYAFDNTELRLPVGAYARVLLQNGEARSSVAVPESALVDDGGTSVVFVQVEGEAFERRIVRTGLADGGFVEILSGVESGEHVVTTGAWSVKLAASSGTVPAHGHAH
jgi:cobalt-zinc-cadmium efflux system membrane fusion protein